MGASLAYIPLLISLGSRFDLPTIFEMCIRDSSMEAGELWCVLGANGVGKSTLFKTLLGLLKPMGGTVLVDGRPVEQWSRAEFALSLIHI